MAGGFSTEDHVFKVRAMGAPCFKAVCMRRAMMTPGFAGSNIEGVVGAGVGLWNELPSAVTAPPARTTPAAPLSS